jgi:hypothetical protein
MQMETVTTGTAVRYFVMAATPSRLYIFQGTTSLEVNFCLPLGILCACSLLCLTPCLLSPSWARDFTAQGPWSSIFDNMFPLLSLRSGNVGWMYVWQAVFMSYAEGIAHFTELPGEIPNSELHFYGKQRRSERFAWLAGPGIYHGHLNLGTSPRSSPITYTLIAKSYLFPKCLLFTANLDYAVQNTDAGFRNDSWQC